MTHYRIAKCRACGAGHLTPLFSLGEHFVSNFVSPGRECSGPKAPLDLVVCDGCTLVQLHDTVPPAELYGGNYWYRSGVTLTMRTALKDVTDWVDRHRILETGDVVLDIGSNDGTLLRSYPRGHLYTKVGFEPAKNLALEGKEGVDVFVNELWSAEAYCKRLVGPPPKEIPYARVITALGMLYDLEDPRTFLRDVQRVLHPEGWFIAQFMTLKNMLDVCDLGNIGHEHLEYYSLYSIQRLLRDVGLKVVGTEENDVNGRSTRFFIRHLDAPVPAWLASEHRYYLQELGVESEQGFYRKRLVNDFFPRMETNKSVTVQYIREVVGAGKKVYVYGASTKGNTIIQYYCLGRDLIKGAAERSPEKWGKVTVGTGIPIVDEETARKDADYFLVLPYAFRKEFLEREANWIRQGGKFLFPLPQFEVYP